MTKDENDIVDGAIIEDIDTTIEEIDLVSNETEDLSSDLISEEVGSISNETEELVEEPNEEDNSIPSEESVDNSSETEEPVIEYTDVTEEHTEETGLVSKEVEEPTETPPKEEKKHHLTKEEKLLLKKKLREKDKKNRDRRNRIRAVIIAVIVILVLLTAFRGSSNPFNPDTEDDADLQFSANGEDLVSSIPYITDFTVTKKKPKVVLGNPNKNVYLKYTFKDNDTGKTIYKSKYVKPEQKISVDFGSKLDVGVYNVNILYESCSLEDGRVYYTTDHDIKLTVKEK
jgi:hypothetical protein